MERKYVVFGAGRMGRAAAWHLLSGTTDTVVIADIDNVALDSLSKELSDAGFASRVQVHRTSSGRYNEDYMSEASLANALSGASVCIATCGYQSYVEITHACVTARVGMVDLGGNRDVVEAQKTFNDSAVHAGVTIVPDCGLAPGMIGILGMYAYETLTKRKCTNIDINMRVGGLPMDPGTLEENPLQYALTWSSDGLINEYYIPADELRNGEIVQQEALSGCEDVTITTPWKGKSEFEAFVTGGGSSNLPFLLKDKARNVNYKTLRYRGHCAIMNGIKKLGFFSDPEQRRVLTAALDKNLQLKDGNDIVIARAGARGTLPDGKPAIIIYEIFCAKDKKRNFSAMAQTTGFSAAIIAQMIADGTITTQGVVDGESVVAGAKFIERLKKTGVKIKVVTVTV